VLSRRIGASAVFTIAHISDLHIGGRPESVERAEQVIAT